MKVVYVANHGKPDNDDEGAIAHALRALGHEVRCVMEAEARTLTPHKTGADLLLFHKWDDPDALARWEGVCPRAFWYFDLVEWPADPQLDKRSRQRRDWMARTLPNVEYGFCTDGDWVAATWTRPDGTAAPHPKLRWLTQGADERVVGRGRERRSGPAGGILFVGGVRGCGAERQRFHDELVRRYPGRVRHYANGVYREALKSAVAAADVVVCPWSPVTDRYWSNRVYLMAGFGGCVLHRSAAGLCEQYDGTEVAYYRDRGLFGEDFWAILPRLLVSRDVQGIYQEGALVATKARHLYRHRVERLLEEVAGGRADL